MLAPNLNPQRNLNGDIHEWYHTVLGFSDHLVSHLIERLGLRPGHRILDPFCGTGTTLVECMKVGIASLGIEANPAAVFASRVKTNWRVDPTRLRRCAADVCGEYHSQLRRLDANGDTTFSYLCDSGMLDRGWISQRPLRRVVALKRAIKKVRTTKPYHDALILALLSEMVRASNVKFGPELYCSVTKTDWPVLAGFRERAEKMAADLEIATGLDVPETTVIQGDARFCSRIVGRLRQFDGIICSPPYPTEHDYTRNTRLELALLEDVFDVSSLRVIKKTMIRSHTKGIYIEDNDAAFVSQISSIEQIVARLRTKVRAKTYGFARLYPRVVQEYFGGMKKHLRSVRPALRAGAKCAYVVGDQSSYLRVYIPTAKILAQIAQESGYKVLGIERLRGRWSTATSKVVNENILIFEREG